MRLLTRIVCVGPPVSGCRSLLFAKMFLRSVTLAASRISIARELEKPVVGYHAGSQGTTLFTPLQARASATNESMIVISLGRVSAVRGVNADAGPDGPTD